MFWRGKHKFSHIEATGVTIGFGGGQNTLMGGKTYFVNCRSGNDSSPGTNPMEPLLTLEAAEAKCVTNKHDFIFVQDFWTLSTESPIVFDKADMHVIGLGSGILFDNGNDIGALASTGVAVQLEGCTDLELAGFNIGGDSTADAISVVGTTYRVHLHHCTFGNNYACLDGIGEGAAGNMGKWLVEDCLFGQTTTGDCINCSMLSSMIRNCVFTEYPEIGIDMPAGQSWNKIFNNTFFTPIAAAEASGWAIRLRTTAYDNMVFGNRASDTGDAAGNNPYRDDSSANHATALNGWGDNQFGGVPYDPDNSGGTGGGDALA